MAPVAGEYPRDIVQLGQEYREVVLANGEFPHQRLPLSPDGTLRLEEGRDFRWPGSAYTNLRIKIKPSATAVPSAEDYETVYATVAREQFKDGKVTVPVFEGPPPAPAAIVHLRTLPTHGTSYWRSTEFFLPNDVQVLLDYGIRPDWEGPGEGHFDLEALFQFPLGTEQFALMTERLEPDEGWRSHHSRFQSYPPLLEHAEGRTASLLLTVAPEVETHDRGFWSVPRILTPASDDPRPNVILISLDTLRRDRMGLHGYERDTSPHLDAFAEECIVFDHAVSSSTWTTPSHASMFTGALPWEHGAGSFHRGFMLQPEWTTIAELARDAGYTTAAFTEGVAIAGKLGFAQGFEEYSDGPLFEDDRSGSAAITFDNSWNWIQDRAAAPFFLFIHTFEIHGPYCSPEPEGTAFVQGEGSNCIYEQHIESLGEGAAKRASDLYDGGVLYTDGIAHQFVERLRGAGLLDNTILIITSDHGEEFGEHGQYGHTAQIYGEVIEVPLMMRVPGAAPRRVPDLVGTRDLFATLADFMDLDDVPETGAQSLADFARQDAAPAYRRDHVFTFMPERDTERVLAAGKDHEYSHFAITSTEGRFMMRDRAWMQQHMAGADATAPEWEHFAFDLLQDPGEQQNLAEHPPEHLRQLREILLERLRQDNALRHAIGTANDKGPGANRSSVSEEAIQAIEAMGYF